MSLDLTNSIYYFLPEIVITLTIILISLNRSLFENFKIKSNLIAITGLSLALIISVLFIFLQPARVFGSMSVSDPLASLGRITIIVSALFILGQNYKNAEGSPFSSPNSSMFIVSLVLGTILMASSVNFVMLIVSISLVDLSLFFILSTGWNLQDKKFSDLNFNAFAVISYAFLILGSAVIYGISGSMDYYTISNFLTFQPYNSVTLLLAILLIILGFSVKIILMPQILSLKNVIKNHSAALLTIIIIPSAISSLIALSRILTTVFHSVMLSTISGLLAPGLNKFNWSIIVQLFAVVSICLSTILLFTKKDLKTIVLYSLAIQTSLFLSGISALNIPGITSTVVVLISFVFISIALFYLLGIIEKHFLTLNIDELKGAGSKNKWLFIPLLVFLASLAGFPLTIGFNERISLYFAILPYTQYWIVTISIISSVLLIIIYFRLFIRLFLMEPITVSDIYNLSLGGKILLLIITLPAILAGIYFEPVVKISEFFSKIYGI